MTLSNFFFRSLLCLQSNSFFLDIYTFPNPNIFPLPFQHLLLQNLENSQTPSLESVSIWDMTWFQVVIKSKCVFYIQDQHGELVLSLALWPQSPRSILPWKHRTSDSRVWVTSHCFGDISPPGGTAGLNGLNFIVLAASQC